MNAIDARIEHLPYADPRNPWYRKWAKAKREPRNAWPWRIRLEFWWFDREYVVGLLYWTVRRYSGNLAPTEPGFGVHVYITGKGWIEGLAT